MDSGGYNVISTIIPWGDETQRFKRRILSPLRGRLVVFPMMRENICILFGRPISLPITDPGARRGGDEHPDVAGRDCSQQ